MLMTEISLKYTFKNTKICNYMFIKYNYFSTNLYYNIPIYYIIYNI